MDDTEAVEMMPSIGERVKIARINKGLKQTKLALLAGISRTSLSKIEAGVQECKVRELLEICDVLGTTPNALLGISVEPSQNIQNLQRQVKKMKIQQLVGDLFAVLLEED